MAANPVPAAARTLDVLETFRGARRPLSLSELARLTRIPVSTCHGLVRTLEQRGFLYYPSPREVYPTRKLLEIARDIDAHDPVVARLRSALTSLRDVTQETVILGMRQDDAALYLLVLDSPHIVRYTADAGEFKPLHSSSIGKTFLGGMTDDALDAWLRSHPPVRVTANTITTARALKRNLQESRDRGYYMTRGENVADVMAIAAPVNAGSAQLAIAIAGPLHRMEEHREKHVERLRATVRAIERQTHG
ncbi:MAG TPA: IclR family transcriptional regulator [Usitatibacter sp.]|nr:IclR family transcriptional regulator [Usitatibacter sp.]